AKPVDLPPPAAATPKPSEPAKPKEAAKPSEPAPKPVSPQPSVHGIARSAPVTPQTQLPPVAVAAENEEKADNKLPTLLAGGALLIAVIALLLALLGGQGDRTVETADLGAEAVTTDKIANGAVTAEKLDPDAVPEGPRGPKG